jgi:hypothetical protein
MKNKIHLGICAAIVALSFGINEGSAQFQIFNAPPLVGRTQPNITAIGIGNFNTSPLSALHVNTNLLPANFNFTTGEVFRTSGPLGSTNAWRMFTGAGNGIERFSLFVPANSSNVFFRASQPDETLVFKDSKNEITLAEIIELKKQVEELNAMLARKN